MNGIWVVEKNERGWAVVDRDGTEVIVLPTRQLAEQWLAFQQEASEMMILHGDEADGP